MEFTSPVLGLLLLSVPVLIWLYQHGAGRRRRALERFLASGLLRRVVADTRPWRRPARAACLVLAAASLVVALMEPRWGVRPEEAPRWGRDIVVVLDVSLSMLAEDAAPNRLEQAKGMVRDLVDEMRGDGGHRLGLVVFAGRASLQSPLTADYALFLERLETAGPTSARHKGTDLGGALSQSTSRFADLDPAFTDIVLLSDGEDHEGTAFDAAQSLAQEGITLYAVALGEDDAAVEIPVPGEDGSLVAHRHHGEEVRTRTRPALLAQLSILTGGELYLVAPEAAPLRRAYRDEIAAKPRRQVAAGTGEYLAAQYQWFALLALALIGLESLLRHPPRKSGAA